MASLVFNAVKAVLDRAGAEYVVLDHEPCRTSEESAAARAEAGYPSPVGAKALLLRVTQRSGQTHYVTAVIPADLRLDSKSVRAKVRDAKSIRFASTDEFSAVTHGLAPGSLPPFGNLIFPMVDGLIVDQGFLEIETVGFNAGLLHRSIIMPTEEYLKIAARSQIGRIAYRR